MAVPVPLQGSDALQHPTTIMRSVQQSADVVQNQIASIEQRHVRRKLIDGLSAAKYSGIWALVAFGVCIVLALLIRPPILYTKDSDYAAPKFHILRVLQVAAVPGAITFAALMYLKVVG